MSIRTSTVPTWRDLEAALLVRFIQVPQVLTQNLEGRQALLLSYLMNQRRIVVNSSPLAAQGKFWVMKSQLTRDLRLECKGPTCFAREFAGQKFLKFDDARIKWDLHLLRKRLLALTQPEGHFAGCHALGRESYFRSDR